MNQERLLYIDINCSIRDALKRMDDIRRKLLIVGTTKKMLGLISIGDIQRAIIKDIPLDISIGEVMRREITCATDMDSDDSIRETMLRIRAEFMPIVDGDNRVKRIVFWEDLIQRSDMPPSEVLDLPVIIMAGGKGSRLKPLTNILPKPLIPIGEKTIVEHIIEKFVKVGCSKFLFSVNFKAELIQYYFDSFDHSKYSVSYFKEDKPLGTAGSLHLLKGRIDTTFFVSNCDIIIDQDYSDLYKYHNDNGNEITAVGVLKNIKIPYGILESGYDGLLTGIQEKPEYTYKMNAGLYVLEPHVLKEIPENKFYHITDLIEKVKNRGGKVGVFPVSEGAWRDIGEWDEYLKNKNE